MRKTEPYSSRQFTFVEVDKLINYLHEGYAKHPCIQIIQTNGLAMDHIQRYARIGRTANPCDCLIRVRGCYGEALE